MRRERPADQCRRPFLQRIPTGGCSKGAAQRGNSKVCGADPGHLLRVEDDAVQRQVGQRLLNRLEAFAQVGREGLDEVLSAVHPRHAQVSAHRFSPRSHPAPSFPPVMRWRSKWGRGSRSGVWRQHGGSSSTNRTAPRADSLMA